DAPKTIGTMNFNSSVGYTLSGSNATTILFDSLTNATAINVTAGNHTIVSPITSVDDMTISVATGSSLAIAGSFTVADTTLGLNSVGRNLTKTGGGSLTVDHVRNTVGDNDATVVPGTTTSLGVNAGRLVISHKGTAN